MSILTKEDVIRDLIKVKNQLGHAPSMKEYELLGEYGPSTPCRIMGSWNKALLTAFGEINRVYKISQMVRCLQCEKEFKKWDSEIRRFPNNFCSKSCSTFYNNTHKTKGTRISKLEKYLQKQLTQLYPTLEIHYNRKDAIDSELDIYIPSLKLAFELNGIFHFEPIFGRDKLSKIQSNDSRKFQVRIEKEISLCIIDTSQQKYFKESSSKKYLDIIVNIINQTEEV